MWSISSWSKPMIFKRISGCQCYLTSKVKSIHPIQYEYNTTPFASAIQYPSIRTNRRPHSTSRETNYSIRIPLQPPTASCYDIPKWEKGSSV